MQHRQHRVGHAGKVMVQEGCEWELNWHSDLVAVSGL
jgi:hypothetical protein